MTIDNLHKPEKKQDAEEWQRGNDSVSMATNRSVESWGSHGSFDASWKYYYEDEAKYERLMKVRKLTDPYGAFAVRRA
jgi:hypothetical protein